MKILITGGAGFIGSHLAERLAGNHQVTIADNLSTGHNIPPEVAFVETDVNDLTSLSNVFAKGFDLVFHYAAVVGVDRTVQNPVKVLEDIEGIKNILQLSKDSDVQRVFFASSSEVYGESAQLPQQEETTPLNAQRAYAVVKSVGETFMKAYQKEYGLDYTIFRFFNTYGPRQSADFVMTRFIKAVLNNEDIPVYGDGMQTRSFCCVYDNIEATINAVEDKQTVNTTINIGSDREITILDLAKKIIKISGSKSKIAHLPARSQTEEGDVSRRLPDITKMQHLLGRDQLPLNNGIKMMLDYIKEYPDGDLAVA